VKARALAVALAVATAGCNTGRVFIASSGDYADYRAVRVAEDIDSRVAAAWEYLKARPDGRYAERLRNYFERAEPVFFNVRSRSIKGLEAYLEALPDGPHADEALRLLGVLRDEHDRDELDTREAQATGRRLDTERKKRDAARGLLVWWLDALMTPSVWQAPLSEAPGDLLVRYEISLPEPVCDKHPTIPSYRKCIKPFERAFKVGGNGKLVPRTLAFELEVDLDARWHLAQAVFTGRDMLLATEEARSGRAIADTPARRRAAAEAFVAKLTAAMFEREVACNGGTDAGGTTSLECEGLRLFIEPGAQGVDDVVRIELVDAPAPPAPAPAPATVPAPAPAPDDPPSDPYD
jgi:hypothetical protein